MIEHVSNPDLGFSRFIEFDPKLFKLHDFNQNNVIGSLGMIGMCYITICCCCLVDSYELDVWICVGMIKIEFGNNLLSKIGVSATSGRRNRFLCGRNRIPGTNSREVKFLSLRNRFPGGRNRVPSALFSKNETFGT